MLAKHLLGRLELSVRHPSLSSVLWQLLEIECCSAFSDGLILLRRMGLSAISTSRIVFQVRVMEHFFKVLNFSKAGMPCFRPRQDLV